MNSTLQYYEENADSFVKGTREADFTDTQQAFLSYLPENGTILDLGCGSGRDARAFLDLGYQVEAVDGSPRICSMAEAFLGVPVRCLSFEEIDAVEQYDGIWACASLLHADQQSMASLLKKIVRALKPEGILYCSFKYGTFSGMRSGRFFQDYTESSFQGLVDQSDNLKVVRMWQSFDVRPDRGSEKWLNVIAKKEPRLAEHAAG